MRFRFSVLNHYTAQSTFTVRRGGKDFINM